MKRTSNKTRLVLSRKAISLAISFLSGKMVDAEVTREEVLLALNQALEMTQVEAVDKFLSMKMACLTAQDYLNPCSCCRKGKCHANCRCSNTGNLRKYLEKCEDLIS